MSATKIATSSADNTAFVTATAVPSSDELPSATAAEEAAGLPVVDGSGNSIPFGELYADDATRILVVFIRHFYCGLKMCQEFINALPAASVTPETLAAASPPTKLVIIGCGEPSLIDDYRKRIGCPFDVYADPTRKLYDTLGMITTLDMGDVRPDYQQSSTVGIVAGSFVAALSGGIGSFTKAGKLSQVGGEFLFEHGKPAWCHRMQNTRGHIEMKGLKALLHLP